MVQGKKQGDIAEYLEPEEMNKLMDIVSGDLYFTTLYKFLRYSGRRIGEIYGTYRNKQLIGGIKISDIDFDRKQLTTIILKTKKQKTKVNCDFCGEQTTNKNKFCPSCGKEMPIVNDIKILEDKKLTISIRPELETILKAYIRENKLKNNNYLFREKALITLKKKIKQHAKQADINKNVSLHSFRKYFITRCKIKGMSNEDVAKWTGHVLPSTINTYDSRISEDVRKQIEEVDL
jgi:integrase